MNIGKKIIFFISLIYQLIYYNIILYADIKIISIKPNKKNTIKYSPIFFNLTLIANYKNPYDPDDIKVDMHIKNSKKEVIIPGFFLRKENNKSVWQFRFTPILPGKHSYFIIIKTKKEKKKTIIKKFNVRDSSLDGFIRRSKNYYYFKFDSGKLFRGLGENFGWESRSYETHMTYASLFSQLKKNHYNFVRTWMCPWNMPLEWKKYGLTHYDPKVAAKLDEVIKLAQKNNIFIMLTFDYHGVLQEKKDQWGANDEWKNNPYNYKLGGPCKSPKEMFSNPIAKKIYKKRLRYIIARWGYSRNIAAFEFWNEIQHVIKDKKLIKKWHEEMAKYLKSIDVNKHLITTSSDDIGDVWKVKDIDFTQSHLYGSTTDIFSDIINYYETKYKKPHVIGEFGYSGNLPKSGEKKLFEIVLHNGLWSGLLNPTPILPLTWWWDYYKKWKSDYIFKSIINFHKEIIKHKKISKYTNIQVHYMKKLKSKRIIYVYGAKPWGKNSNKIFKIDSSGNISYKNLVPQYLYSGKKVALKNPPVFEVNYKKDGEFYVYVGRVSGQNLLRIYVDGKPVFEKYLILKKGEGEWKESEYKPQWGIFQGVYDKYYGVKIKKGRHTIKVENVTKKDGDWINIVKYVFINTGIDTSPQISIIALKADGIIFLWAKHDLYSAMFIKKNNQLPKPLRNTSIELPTIKKGIYSIKYYDTYKGKFYKIVNIQARKSSGLSVPLPPLQKDIALMIEKK